jgi:hypothetical protein
MKVDIRSKNRLNLCQSSGHASSDLLFLQSSLKYQKGREHSSDFIIQLENFCIKMPAYEYQLDLYLWVGL